MRRKPCRAFSSRAYQGEYRGGDSHYYSLFLYPLGSIGVRSMYLQYQVPTLIVHTVVPWRRTDRSPGTYSRHRVGRILTAEGYTPISAFADTELVSAEDQHLKDGPAFLRLLLGPSIYKVSGVAGLLPPIKIGFHSLRAISPSSCCTR